MAVERKVVLITGITGQDGAYLAKSLLARDYIVFGSYRRTSQPNFWRLNALGISSHRNLRLVECDLTDLASLIGVLKATGAREVYNLAAQSFVGTSFSQPILTGNVTGIGALNLLEAIRLVDPHIKFYQASSSEMFGRVQSVPQTEETNFYPRSPYAVAKLYAHWMTVNYREAHGIFGVSGILFNHESFLRGEEFVTRKITTSVAGIYAGVQQVIELGNLNAARDWGHAQDYVEAMRLMMETEEADTYLVSTGVTRTVRDFVEAAFGVAEIEIEWDGECENEQGFNKATGELLIRINSEFFRPAEVDLLIGDSSKIRSGLGWVPTTSFESLVEEMVRADIDRVVFRR
jgi:GDPmannose 4,6-dehydratase